jgi:hypothetical protein
LPQSNHGSGKRAAHAGVITFIEPEYIAEPRTTGSRLPNTVMRAPSSGQPFLPPMKIAKMNPGGTAPDQFFRQYQWV